MTTPNQDDQGAGRAPFDPRRSAEIRSLLVRTVAATPRPRRARLSRTAFALAASAALLFAGGIGAGTVVAYDRVTDDIVAQDAGAPAVTETVTGSLEGAESLSDGQSDSAASDSAADSDLPAPGGGDLAPILTLNGETGYAYRGDLQAAKLLLLYAVADSAESGVSPASAGQVPIYRADGVTVLGYLDPASLVP